MDRDKDLGILKSSHERGLMNELEAEHVLEVELSVVQICCMVADDENVDHTSAAAPQVLSYRPASDCQEDLTSFL